MSYCSFSSLIWSLIVDFYYIMELHSEEFTFYVKIFFWNLKGLSDASVVSLTKKEYGSAVHFLYILLKSLVLIISDEWFIAI